MQSDSSRPRSEPLFTARSSGAGVRRTPFVTRWTLPVFFSSTRKSLLPMKAKLVGCESPVTTVFTERLGSSIEGPLAGAATLV